MICHKEVTKDWLAARVPTLVAIECSRFYLVGLDDLPTCEGCGAVLVAASLAEPESGH